MLFASDPFADSQEERRDQTKVHVRVQQRSGRKCITTVQGLADDLDLKRILKAFKKNFRYDALHATSSFGKLCVWWWKVVGYDII